MKIDVDGQERALSGAPDFILRVVSEEASREGRVITEIRVDDVEMEEEAFLNVTGGLTAHFATRSIRELVGESLEEALQYIPRLTKGLGEIALHFEENEIAIGQGKLADAADGLDWLLHVFQRCTSLLAVGNEAGGPELERLKTSLSESVDTLGTLHEKREYLQMSLCIRQKLVPEIESFRLHVQNLRDFGSSVQ